MPAARSPQPLFSGRVHLTNVAMALKDLPNGISKLNGNLIFDQNRLQVQDLVGTTGGGQLKLGGFLTYQQGIYGDFTATGKDIRVRLPGHQRHGRHHSAPAGFTEQHAVGR